MSVSRAFLRVTLLAWVLAVAGCSDGGSRNAGGSPPPPPPPPPPAAVARVVIQPGSVLLTEAGQQRTLVARAYDASGAEITGRTVSWSSSSPSALSVSPSGVLRAEVANGSAQIVATIDNVRSRPVLAVVTRVPQGAVLVADGDIAGEVREAATNGPPGTPGNRLEFTWGASAAPPAVGAIVIGTGEKPVAGRVAEVERTDGRTVVRFTPGPLLEVFPELVIDEEFQLGPDDVEINPEIAAAYDVVRDGARYEFRPKATAAAVTGAVTGEKVREVGRQQAVGTGALPPFTDCETDSPLDRLPLSLDAPPLFSFEFEPRVQIVKNAPDRIDRWLVVGPAEFDVEAGLEVDAAFAAKIECKAELVTLSVPVGGPLSLLIGGVIPVGVGFEIGGEVTVAQLKAVTKVGSKARIELGLACADGGSCSMVRELRDSQFTLEPELALPGGETGLDQLRLEVEAKLFGYAEVQFGSRLFRRLRVEALEARAGAGLEGEFAPAFTQTADASFKAKYAGKGFVSAEAGTELGGLAELLGLDEITFLELGLDFPFAESPQGRVTANRRQFLIGESVRFTVEFGAPTVDFIPGVGPFNLREVVLIRQVPGGVEEVARQPAVTGQSVYMFDVVAPASGRAEEYFGFVVTRLAPFDFFALEVGAATSRPTAWSPSVAIATSRSSFDYLAAAANRAGQAAIAWVRYGETAGEPGRVYVSRYEPGTGWSAPQIVSNNAYDAFDVSVAMDEAGRITVAYWAPVAPAVIDGRAAYFNHVPFAVRYQPGEGWEPPVELVAPQTGREMVSGALAGVSMTEDGLTWVSWVEFFPQYNSSTGALIQQESRLMSRARRPDQPGWDPARLVHSVVATEGPTIWRPRQHLAADGTGTIVWGGRVGSFATASADLTAWREPVLLTDQDSVIAWTTVAGNGAGRLVAAWRSLDRRQVIARRYEPGQGWLSPVAAYTAAAELPAQQGGRFELAVQDDGTARLILTQQEQISVNGSPRTVTTVVATGQTPGASWEAPRRLSVLDSSGQPTGASSPLLGVDGAGQAWVTWFARSLSSTATFYAEARESGVSAWSEGAWLDDSGTVQTRSHALAVSRDGGAVASWVTFDGEVLTLRASVYQ